MSFYDDIQFIFMQYSSNSWAIKKIAEHNLCNRSFTFTEECLKVSLLYFRIKLFNVYRIFEIK